MSCFIDVLSRGQFASSEGNNDIFSVSRRIFVSQGGGMSISIGDVSPSQLDVLGLLCCAISLYILHDQKTHFCRLNNFKKLLSQHESLYFQESLSRW